MTKKCVLKICSSAWENASRDKRELSVCQELGMSVCVLAKGNVDDKLRKDKVDNFEVIRFSTRPLGEKKPITINRIISLFVGANYVRRIAPDIVSGEDIIGVLIGYISNWFRPNVSQLIYDSHEFEIGRNVKRNALQSFLVKHLERFLIKRCAFSVMVNDLIADEVQDIHKLKERPIVVRSTPNLWTIDTQVCKETREILLSNFRVGGETFIIMYHGLVTEGRGIEELIELLSLNYNVCCVILGNGSSEYLNRLRDLSEKLSVRDRLQFHEAVPIDELWKYLGAADVGMITLIPVTKSYYYMLPNKFFENIQSETPVICSDFPAIASIVREYDIGLTCNPSDVNDINACVERLRQDKDLYNKFKKNIRNAKEDLCWEKEKEKLKNAYRKLM